MIYVEEPNGIGKLFNSKKSDQMGHRRRAADDLASFPFLNQINPRAPLLVVPFRQFLQVFNLATKD